MRYVSKKRQSNSEYLETKSISMPPLLLQLLVWNDATYAGLCLSPPLSGSALIVFPFSFLFVLIFFFLSFFFFFFFLVLLFPPFLYHYSVFFLFFQEYFFSSTNDLFRFRFSTFFSHSLFSSTGLHASWRWPEYRSLLWGMLCWDHGDNFWILFPAALLKQRSFFLIRRVPRPRSRSLCSRSAFIFSSLSSPDSLEL